MNDGLKRVVRRAFERAAPSYDDAAFLQQEIARRLDEHLDGVKLAPARILDAGCGTGYAFDLLRARYAQAELIGLDIAHGMLRTAQARSQQKGWRGWLARFSAQRPAFAPVCADLEQLPLAAQSVDLVWSNLALQWVDLERAFAEVRRVLRPGGLFLFASFGPDTLQELRAASTDLDGHRHVNRFIDMHDVGDALMHAGFAAPVMEMEHLTLTYTELRALLAELKAIGAHTVLEQGRRGLMGKNAWQRLAANYETYRRDGRLPATYEVVYGHAWAGDEPPQGPRRDDGRQVIRWMGRRA